MKKHLNVYLKSAWLKIKGHFERYEKILTATKKIKET